MKSVSFISWRWPNLGSAGLGTFGPIFDQRFGPNYLSRRPDREMKRVQQRATKRGSGRLPSKPRPPVAELWVSAVNIFVGLAGLLAAALAILD
jgi:hypothetical protein